MVCREPAVQVERHGPKTPEAEALDMARQSQKTQKAQEAGQAQEKPETLQDTAEEATEAITEAMINGPANGEALAAMLRANEVLFQGLTAMQREIIEFGNARLRQDLETQEALSQCGDLQEAFRMQADFAQKALQQYSEETAKLMELSAKIGRDCWSPLADATRATFQAAGKR